jgi:hypothetical protein
MYADGRLGMIKPQLLDRMMDRKLVSGILRSDGWAIVGRDKMRGHRRSQGYEGVDRRSGLLTAPFGMELVMKLLQETLLIIAVLVLTSILLSGLL